MESMRALTRFFTAVAVSCLALVSFTAAVAATPTIASLSPSSATAGGAAFTLTVTGTNFITGATVKWGTASLTTTVVSATQVTAPVTTAMIATAGTVNVTATTSGGTSAAKAFAINAAAPTIASLSPSSATAGGAAFTLTVTGTNFITGATVKWGTASLTTTVVSATQVTAPVTTAMIATAGTVNVTVTTSGGTSAAKAFAINAAAQNYVLTINSTNPASGVAIGVSPADKNGASNGSTSFTRTYVSGTAVSLTAPTMSGSNIFSSWTGCTSASTVTCNATINGNMTVTANYTVYTGPTITTAPTLQSGFVGQQYYTTISLNGGAGPYTWKVNGSPVSISGSGVDLTNGLSAANYGDNNLYISGTPASANSLPYTISFSANATDSSSPAQTSPTVQFSITVYGQGYTVSGNINNVNCGGTVPAITVSINTNPAQTTTTDSNGHFEFDNSIPPGNYTVTPSITGPSSIFYPATQNVVVNADHQSPNVNFQASLGYTVTGTVSYSGSATGRIYLAMMNNGCGNLTPGTSVSSTGAFTIRGVPPGSYTLQAWMDNLNSGAQNASNPLGSAQVTVPKSTRPTITTRTDSKPHRFG